MLHFLKRSIYWLFHSPKDFVDNIMCQTVDIWPSEFYLRVRYRLHFGFWPDFKHPQTFNEKLNWLKLHDIHSEYSKMVDKYEAKKYVTSIIGEDYIIPTIGLWNNVDDIDWKNLPNKFVIKSTRDSGGVVVCKDKSKLDIEKAIKKLKVLGGRNYNKISKEYPYENIRERYLAEEYVEDESGFELKDYKIFCFDGEAKFLFVATGRQQHDTRFDFYDLEFNHLPVLNGHPNADIWPVKPQNFEKMIDIAGKLSKGIPHVRVDLYNVNGKIYFGELTFFHWSGMVPFEPLEWDYKFGELLKLPIGND